MIAPIVDWVNMFITQQLTWPILIHPIWHSVPPLTYFLLPPVQVCVDQWGRAPLFPPAPRWPTTPDTETSSSSRQETTAPLSGTPLRTRRGRWWQSLKNRWILRQRTWNPPGNITLTTHFSLFRFGFCFKKRKDKSPGYFHISVMK